LQTVLPLSEGLRELYFTRWQKGRAQEWAATQVEELCELDFNRWQKGRAQDCAATEVELLKMKTLSFSPW
jgi:hypothetical protein